MSYTHLQLDISDKIATITFNRPEARNAISEEMRVAVSYTHLTLPTICSV